MTAPVEFAEPPPAVLAVRYDLLQFGQLLTRVGGAQRIVLRKPADVDDLWIWVRSAGGFAIEASRGAWSRTVQIEVGASRPVGPDRELPELATQRVGSLVAAYLTDPSRRARVFQGASWRARYLDGPFELTDTSRGADAPVYKHGVRVDVRMHAHV